MSRHITSALGRAAARSARASVPATSCLLVPRLTTARASLYAPAPHTLSRATFSTSAQLRTPISAEQLKAATPAPLSDEEYHDVADRYLEDVQTKFEELAETREDVDVEYSAGVMKIGFLETGEYVINKQPPNKQIWLSSPVSGPKRYDYVLLSEGQNDKQDTATGAWVYLRDGSTLDEVLQTETGISLESSSTSDIEP
ncbi:Frataxin-like domain-domain-containing protein [Microdochium bolleyi]|uniref:ferroxidase n=1 Tax=Microdochium bolleyi TaxID=196109 RepID=A0A136JIR9_9PEZI|nr:Frataxin-like domain-domain-containing protein [Microdochium bolleyi]